MTGGPSTPVRFTQERRTSDGGLPSAERAIETRREGPGRISVRQPESYRLWAINAEGGSFCAARRVKRIGLARADFEERMGAGGLDFPNHGEAGIKAGEANVVF